MRTFFYSLVLLSLSAVVSLGEETGREVHLHPDVDSPVIGVLPADSLALPPPEPVELTSEQVQAGWQAVSFLDDFEGYVRQAEIRKDFTVTVGAPIHLEASDESPILTRSEEGDHYEVEQLSGEWTEVSFRKPLVGFIREGGANEVVPPEATLQESESEPLLGEELYASADEPDAEMPDVAPGSVVAERQAIPADGMLRTFQGWLTPTRSFFGLGQPFSEQIVDQSGNRIAYVDLSKLLITEPMGQLYGHRYEVYGRAEPVEGRRDFVIRVERMLRK